MAPGNSLAMKAGRKSESVIAPIQYLRGLAAVLVLFHHIAFKLSGFANSPLRWLHSADVGVDVFFVISGFVMAHSVRHKPRSVASVDDFLRGRVARIVPLYWLVTLVANIVYLGAPQLVNSSGGTTDVVASYFLLPTGGKYLVQNGWTLAYEFYFYAVFSTGLLMPRLLGRALVGATLCSLGGVGFLVPRVSPAEAFFFDPIVVEFAAGMLIYTWYERGAQLGSATRLLLFATAVAGWAVVNSGHATGVRIVDYGVAASLLCLAAVTGPRRTPTNGRDAFRWLGDISYSLYLSHPFVVATCVVTLAHGPRFTAANPAIAGLFMLGASIASAGVLYRWGEMPLVEAARRLLRRRAPAPQPV
jgi:exopolysaccharide production protein ExoZ